MSGGALGGEEKRLRRQIANCNERRRMQSINQGFQSLRQLLPSRKDGDKMSKAAILSATADFIHNLQMEKARLEDIIRQEEPELVAQAKRQRLDEDSMDMSSEQLSHKLSTASSQQSAPSLDVMECLRTIEDLRQALAKEQQLRIIFERELLASGRISSQAAAQSDISPLLTITQQPQQNNSQRQIPILIPGNDVSPCALPQHQSMLASLTSALSTLRGVFAATNRGHLTIDPSQNPSDVINPSALLESFSPGATSVWQSSNSLVAGSQPTLDFSNGINRVDREPSCGTSASLSQRNLQAILEAIRHIEGGDPAQVQA
jgi:hypothetical protein